MSDTTPTAIPAPEERSHLGKYIELVLDTSPMIPRTLLLRPVPCSDVPVLRKARRSASLYLCPPNGSAWCCAIPTLADFVSPARAERMARIAGPRAPTWQEHLSIVLEQVVQVVH